MLKIGGTVPSMWNFMTHEHEKLSHCEGFLHQISSASKFCPSWKWLKEAGCMHAGRSTSVYIPWRDFVAVKRARVDPAAPKLDPSSVRQLGLVLSRFEFNGLANPNSRPGRFSLKARFSFTASTFHSFKLDVSNRRCVAHGGSFSGVMCTSALCSRVCMI
jgi:hypothetical protein